MQARSMRYNLLFFNFEEQRTPDDRKNENCIKIIHDLSTIKIDRAHRVGGFITGKTCPIVAKFNFFQDKLSIKRSVQVKRDQTVISVSAPYPAVIKERRKTLIPELAKAKQKGKTAALNYDKLYTNGRRFIPENVQS